MKLTEWYPPEIRPARRGLYYTSLYPGQFDNPPRFMWDGRQWTNPITGYAKCDFQDRYWRGLARKPK